MEENRKKFGKKYLHVVKGVGFYAENVVKIIGKHELTKINKLDQLSKNQQLDTSIIIIQKSTRTTAKSLSPLHNKLRAKYKWYYNWHLSPIANKVHIGLATTMVLVALFVSASVFGFFPQTTQAAGATKYALTGNWGDAGTWTLNSDGTMNATVAPTNQDDVRFNQYSGAVTISATATAKTVDFTNGTGYTNTLTHNAYSLTVSGSVTFVSGMTYTPLNTSTLILNADSTLTTGTKLMPLINATSGTLTLGDNLNFMASPVIKLTLSGTALNLNGKTIAGNSTTNRVLIQSATLGTAATVTVSGGTFANADFQDIAFNNAGVNLNLSAITGLSGDCGGNSMSGGGTLTFTTGDTETWKTAAGGSWSGANWQGASLSRVPLPQDNVVMDLYGGGDYDSNTVITADLPRLGKSIDWTGVTYSGTIPTWNLSSTGNTSYGNLTLQYNMTVTHNNGKYFLAGRSAYTLTSNYSSGNKLYWLNITAPGGTYTLADALTTGERLQVDAGTFRTSGNTVNASTGFYSQGSNTRTVDISNSTINLASGMGGYGWGVTNAGLTLTTAGSTIVFTRPTQYSSVFVGGTQIYNNITIATGSGTLTFSGGFTFANMTMSSSGSQTIKFTKNTTYTMTGTHFFSGAAGNLVTINSDDGATAFTLNKTSTGVVASDYLNLDRSTATPANTWYAGAHSTDGGHNNGWSFVAPSTAPDPPTGAAINNIDSTAFDVNWSDNSTNETGFKVYISTTSNANCSMATYPGSPDFTTAADATNQAVTGKSASANYCAKVVATNSSGDSSASYSAQATTLGVTTANFYAGYIYLQESPGIALSSDNDVYYSPIPDPSAIPITDATVVVLGQTVTTAWQGMFVLNQSLSVGDILQVNFNQPLTLTPLQRTITVPNPQSQNRTVTGYLAKSSDNSQLVFQNTPATQDKAIYALRVTMDGTTKIMPMDDGHFTFNNVTPGNHIFEAWAIFGGKIRHISANITAEGGKAVVLEGIQTSFESAPPLSFYWTVSEARYGNPTGFYINTCVVDDKGNLPGSRLTGVTPDVGDSDYNITSNPNDPNYFFIQETGHDGSYPWVGSAAVSGNCLSGHEQSTTDSVTATATLGNYTISETRSAPVISAQAHASANFYTAPNPIIIDQPAIIRWPDPGSSLNAGISLSLDDFFYGQTSTVSFGSAPHYFNLNSLHRGYYPRNYWILSSAGTSQFTSGKSYKVTTNVGDTLDSETINQRACSFFSFTVYDADHLPAPNLTLSQASLPLSDSGTFDGYLYFAQPPSDVAPITNTLVISPYAVSYAVPLGSVTLNYGGDSVTTSRTGHLHLSGLSPGTQTFSISSATNPTNGWTFSQSFGVTFINRASYTTSETSGTFIAYLYFNTDTSTFTVSDHADATKTPLLSARILIDSPNDATDPSSSNIRLPDSDGSIVMPYISAGTHHIRAEGIKDGIKYIIEQDITIYNGIITTINNSSSTTQAALALNVLAVEAYGQSGTDADNTRLLIAVDSNGNFPSYNTAVDNYFVTFGPDTIICSPSNSNCIQASDGTWWMKSSTGGTSPPGTWGAGYAHEAGRYKVWTNIAGFDNPDDLLLETPEYAASPIGNPSNTKWTPNIQTFPSPLVSGKPGVVYWATGQNTEGYVFSVRNSFLSFDIAPANDPFAGLTRSSISQVRVLSSTDTAIWLSNTYQHIPYHLTIDVVNSSFINQEVQHSFNYLMSTPVNNRSPILQPPGDKSATAGSNLSFTLAGSDPDWDRTTYSASNLPSGASFNASTQTFSWTPNASDVGTHSDVQLSLSDTNSHTVNQDISITVNPSVPDAPTIGTATAGDGSATVFFSPPANNGGADITSYTVFSTPGNYSGSGTSSPIVVNGLQNGVSYAFKVYATNGSGNSLNSDSSNSVTPASSSNTIGGTTGGTTGGTSTTSTDSTVNSTDGSGAASSTSSSSTPGTAESSSSGVATSATSPASYDVSVTVFNEKTNQPIVDAKVTIHSATQTGTTDKNGQVKFDNVEPGNHQLTIAYNGSTVTKDIALTGSVKNINFSIPVTFNTEQPTASSNRVWIGITILAVMLLSIAAYLLFKNLKKPN